MIAEVDIDKLRKDLINNAYGAFIGGSFGGAFINAEDIMNASDEEIIEFAENNKIDLFQYVIPSF